jgi:hypothetical protein
LQPFRSCLFLFVVSFLQAILNYSAGISSTQG